MRVPKLTPEEQAHIAKGGRVLIVEEIPGPWWRVLMVKGSACRVLLKPDGMDGYSDRETAHQNALAVANLAEDRPMVRG
ncbi:hypothetical protein FIX32_21525 [Salmonella enterica]|nr:hypothetical protein [Salmonella enterica]